MPKSNSDPSFPKAIDDSRLRLELCFWNCKVLKTERRVFRLKNALLFKCHGLKLILKVTPMRRGIQLT